MYKFTPLGYFGGVTKRTRTPYAQKYKIEDDGLEKYYSYAVAG